MHFGFSDDQLAFRAAVRDLLRDTCPPSAVRAAWDGGPGYDPDLWSALGEMGILGMLAPERAGGLGLSEVDLVLVLEETGRVAMPGPIVEHAAVALPALAGDRPDLVQQAATGAAIVTFAASADRVGWAQAADHVLVRDGDGLRLISAADLTTIHPLVAVDRSRRDAAIGWAAGEPVVGADPSLALDRAALGAAAQLCGLADHLIAVTVDYVTQRRQFGVPIGSYQAVKHHLADAALRLAHARPAVYRAAWTVATAGEQRSRDVSMAKALAADAATLAARVALQCHGAIGYTWESDLHLWMKRVWILERAWGGTAHHRARVADAVLGPQPV
ncbi:MAG: acyl-CoA dehydrogenase [Acidimicrobiales bacterium]